MSYFSEIDSLVRCNVIASKNMDTEYKTKN